MLFARHRGDQLKDCAMMARAGAKAAIAADEASFALRAKLKPPPWSIRKYMIENSGGIYRWRFGNFIALRVMAEFARGRSGYEYQRTRCMSLVSDAETYERRIAVAVQPGDVERLKTKMEAGYSAMTAALEEIIALPFRGLATAIQKLQLADELGDISEFDGRPPLPVEERSDHARLFISAMDELTHLASEG